MDWSYVAGYFDGEGSVRFKAAPSRPDYPLIGLSWGNTHYGSLEAIKDFIGCGILGPVGKKPGYKQMYALVVTPVEDILRVGASILPHLIIKHDALVTMMSWAREHRTSQPKTWGALTQIGPEEISRLYHEEQLTQQQIAARVGVSAGAVATFFLRNGINGRRRGPAEGAYGILAAYGYDKLHAMFNEGMTMGEIAKIVGVNAKTVYMHFYTRGIRLSKKIRRARAQRTAPVIAEAAQGSLTFQG